MLLVIRLVPDSGAYIRCTRFLMQANFSKFSASYQKKLEAPDFTGLEPASMRVNPPPQGLQQPVKTLGRKKAPHVRGYFFRQQDQANKISSPSTRAVIAVPGKNLPERINCASGFSIQR